MARWSLLPLYMSTLAVSLFHNGTSSLQNTTFSNGNQNPVRCPTEQLATLKLFTMLPYRDPLPTFNPSWDQGRDILPAMDLAAEQINNRSDILPCHELELVHIDGGCDIIPKVSLGVVTGLFNGSEVVGVIGPGCSVSAVETSKVANDPAIEVVVLHDAGSPLLADRTKYTNSIGILGSTQAFVDLSLALMQDTGWHHIAILYESTRLYYRTAIEDFIDRITESLPDVRILFQAAVFTTFYPLDEVRNSLARIVFLFTSPEHSRRIMCLAYHKGLVYPGYQWIMASRDLNDFMGSNGSLAELSFPYDGIQYTCSYETLLDIALENTFIMSYQLSEEKSSDVKPLVNTNFSEFFKLYQEKVDVYNSENTNNTISTTYWAYNMYDAVWAWAIVLDQLTSAYGGFTLSYGNKTMADMILEQFYLVNFQGMSGSISFNSSNGFVNRRTNLNQVVNGREELIASTNGSDLHFKTRSYVFIPDIVKIVGFPHSALVGFFLTLQCLEFFVVTTLYVLTILFRKSKSVKASSPQLSHSVFLGLYLLNIATIFLSASEINEYASKTSGILCQILWAWLLPISFTLIVGTVAVRTWRLYRIFTHYLNPGRFISTPALFLILVILLLVDIFIATLWTITDSLHLVLVSFTVENGSANELMLDRKCTSSILGGLLWPVMVHTYKIALIIFVVTLTILTRSIPNKTFATSSLRVFSYTFSSVYLLGFTTFYLLLAINHNSNADYATLSIMFNTMLCLVIACIAAPPLLPIVREKLENYCCARKDYESTVMHN